MRAIGQVQGGLGSVIGDASTGALLRTALVLATVVGYPVAAVCALASMGLAAMSLFSVFGWFITHDLRDLINVGGFAAEAALAVGVAAALIAGRETLAGMLAARQDRKAALRRISLVRLRLVSSVGRGSV